MSRLLQWRPVEVEIPAHGVFVLESHHASGFRMEASSHDFLEVFHVISGRGIFRIDGEIYRCRAGDVVVVPIGGLHQIEDEPGEPLGLYGICVAPQVCRHDPTLTGLLPAGRVAGSDLLAPRIRSDLRRLLYEQTLAGPASVATTLGMTLQLLAQLARAQAGRRRRSADPPPGLREAIRSYVDELQGKFFEPSSIDRAAARLGMSRRRFTQLFRGATGTSWSNYVTGLRLDYACRLLRETDRSITAIAFECGYEDLSSFYRAFKRMQGQTPNEWRRRERSA